ncbi:hypothetical protein P700755_000824 [Psychroflexus torquis ATCC 700755]|uniref:Secreted protein n=1 Tax=Psychroflexus torquis (strain ATCC 700755 / CIP 106069 / ACAM 623) TaxID=313595 RepID=K4ID58_PSYTT|nr:hypothetical protein [Psychroflexus torquis]AFU67818.1 hypothetical protein P700755_000824 [Psychroflexus torquis ATCC 700755]
MGKLSQAAGVLGVTLATMSVNADTLDKYTNKNEADVKKNLTELFADITTDTKNDTSDATAEVFKRIKPEFTPKERAMITNVSTKLATLRDAVLTATSDDERTVAQTSLDTFRATDPEFAKLVTKRAELLAKAVEEKRLARYILTVPDQISDSPSQETRNQHRKFASDHIDNETDYRILYRKLSFLEAKDGISTIENKSPVVVAWEKEHHMEIVSQSGKIRVFHNRQKVSTLLYPKDYTSHSINVSGETLVFTYSDAIKENNVILYYLENNNLMEKTENSGTSALFEVSN